LQELRDTYGDIFLVDCGDTFHGRNKYPKLRADLIFSGMSVMGYDALNIGEGELGLGVDYLIGLAQKYDINLVSANIAFLNDQNKVSPYIIKEINGVKIAVTGVLAGVYLDDQPKLKNLVHVEKTNKALDRILTQLNDKADIILLLSHLGYQGTKNLFLYNNPKSISVAIVGHGRRLSQKVELFDGTLAVQNSMGGEQLSYLKIITGKEGGIETYELVNIPLTDEVSENPDLKQKMDEFERQAGKIANGERVKKQTLTTLQLSPEEFLKTMEK